MARITRIPHKSRQYVAFPVLLGVADTSEAIVEVSIQPVGIWGTSPEPSFTSAEWGQDAASPTVQVLIGPGTDHELEIGLYRILWRITSGAESTIVSGNRYIEVH